jgi:general stress protein YciG
MSDTLKKKRGLAGASQETRKRVALAGGKSLAKKHQGDMYYHEIGSLGGQSTAEEMKDTKFYQQIGQKGGKARQKKGY